MNLEALKNEVLLYLYEGYVNESSTAIYTINEVVEKYSEDAHELGTYLLENGWIKNQQYLPLGFACSITMDGISEVAPDYIEEKLSKVISTLGILGEWQSLIEILSFEPKDFQRAFDIAKYLERTGLIAESQYRHDDVYIKLSLRGKHYYEQNKANFTS